MNKLNLWRKGDRLTANKLNDAIRAVNHLIDQENERLENESITNTNNSGSGIQYNAVSHSDNIPSWYQNITPLWDQDGETVIYDDWDNLGRLTDISGLYGREVGVNAMVSTGYKDSQFLSLIKSEEEIKEGQQIVQTITINSDGQITNNALTVYNSVNEIPQATINPCGDSIIYRRLSRIITDSSHSMESGESVAAPSNSWGLKSVATNDFNISPITVNAINGVNSNDDDKTDDEVIKQQIGQLVKYNGVFSKIKGIDNKGGLSLESCDSKLSLQSGIEFYSAPSVSCNSGVSPSYTCLNCGIIPKGKKVTLAEFPVNHSHYEYDYQTNQYNLKSNSNNSLKIVAEPINNKSWQWGIQYSGDIDISSYKYIPPNIPNSNTTFSEGEGISISSSNNNYTISRNIFLESLISESGDSISGGSSNAISIYCCKDGNKITYKLYAAANGGQSYEFDPDYFCVTCNNVKLKSSVFQDIANEVINDIEVVVSSCGIVDTISNGQIKTATTGLSWDGVAYSADTAVSKIDN